MEEFKNLGMEKSGTPPHPQVLDRVLKGLPFCSTLQRFRVGFDVATSVIKSCLMQSSVVLRPLGNLRQHMITHSALGQSERTSSKELPWSSSWRKLKPTGNHKHAYLTPNTMLDGIIGGWGYLKKSFRALPLCLTNQTNTSKQTKQNRLNGCKSLESGPGQREEIR